MKARSKNNTHVVVLQGGFSSEREVSLVTGKAVYQSLEQLGYNVSSIDVQKDISNILTDLKPDIAFNALHGTFGEDGCIQGLLETLGIPYTHSGVLASALAMNKEKAKCIFKSVGILCPSGFVLSLDDLKSNKDPMKRPYVIKPVSNGSSVGVFIIDGKTKLPDYEQLSLYGKHFIVEEYIPGKELSVAVTDDKPLDVMELIPTDNFYDYKNKYTEELTKHILPAIIPEKIYNEALETAFKAHKILDCRGLTRADFRYNHDGNGKLYLLEINTQPGFTPLSIAPEIAASKGITFNQLVQYLVEAAQCRQKK